MISKTQNTFMPLFRSWFATADLASQLQRPDLADSSDNLLADVDLGPMVEAESALLAHAPTTAAEAVCLLEVVRQNIPDAGRSDGLDIRALEAIQAWLAKLALREANMDEPVERLLRQASLRG